MAPPSNKKPPTPSSGSSSSSSNKKSSSDKGKTWISSKDLTTIVEILVKADQITPEEAVRRLNNMCEMGTLTIVPVFGKLVKH